MNTGDEWGVCLGVFMKPDHLSHEMLNWAEAG